MLRTNIYLEERQAEQLDAMACELGVSRAEVIRTLLDVGLGGSTSRLEDDLAAIDGSFGALRSEVDFDVPARGLDARAEHLDHMWRAS